MGRAIIYKHNSNWHPEKIILASNNVGKLKEFTAFFASHNWTWIPQSDYTVPDVAETGLSFIENALIKARHASMHTGLPALADDSGLAVDALNGQPGIYSARYAGTPCDDKKNMHKLIGALQGVEKNKRSAHFHCALALVRHANDPTPLICQGRWQGLISESAQGEHGFGYDPIFYVPEQACTAAQLSANIKNSISHRAIAMQQLKQILC